MVTPYNYTASAGIADARLLAATLPNGTSAIAALSLNQATVTTPGPNALRSAWIQDSDGGIEIALPNDGAITFARGQRITGVVTRVTNLGGHSQITGLTATAVVTDGDVFVPEATGLPIGAPYDAEVLHVYGQITQVVGSCRAYTCFELSRGGRNIGVQAPSGVSYDLDDCVDLYAPAYFDVGTAAFQILNQGWSNVYGSAAR